ncbi:MAG: hypothetical protein PW845_08745 [Pseudomonas sp.]|nr:hypothetical protein [Pseudomonas sp.]
MTNVLIALLSFTCLVGSAAAGWWLRQRLPENHLSDDSIGVIKLATGLIATMAALVLGLLISSAKGTFDRANAQLVSTAAQVEQFDRVLARYGPPTQDLRGTVLRHYRGVIDLLATGNTHDIARLNDSQAIQRSEALREAVVQLPVANEEQAVLKKRALTIMDDVFSLRGLLMLQAIGPVPPALLVALIAWLSIIFASFGLLSARNATVFAVVLMCALSTSTSILLIEELNRPLDGLIGISLEPMRDILDRLGQ